MKKILICAAFTLISAIGFSQESAFAVKGGLNFNNYSGKNVKSDSNIGFHIGATYENYFSNVLGIETGLFVDTRGAKLGDSKETIIGLTIPVLAKAKIEVGTLNVFLNAGPYANIGLTGIQDAKDIKFGDEGVNRFQFGLNFGGGVELNQFIIGLGYDLGLTDTSKNSEITANAIKISLGYKF